MVRRSHKTPFDSRRHSRSGGKSGVLWIEGETTTVSSEPQTWADLQNTGNAQSQLLLQAIARHADWDTGECHVRYERLGRMGKCSTKTVQRHIRQMESDGFIERIARTRDDGSQGANTLRLVG